MKAESESAVRQRQESGSESESDSRIRLNLSLKSESVQLKDASDSLLTRQEAARLLRVNPTTVDKWARQGDFNAYRHRGELRYLKSEVLSVWKAKG